MFSNNPAAAKRMMRALCVCDNRIIRTAVRRYVDGLPDAELESLLHRSLTELDSYHRMLLELGLSAGTFANSGEAWELRKMFAAFVSENPRALEQLSPAIIQGVLRQAALADPSLARDFLVPSLRPKPLVASAVAGALCAVIMSLAYVQFNPRSIEPRMAPAANFTTHAFERHPAARGIVASVIRHTRQVTHARSLPVAQLSSGIHESTRLHMQKSARGLNPTLRAGRVTAGIVRTAVVRLFKVPKDRARRVAALPSVARVDTRPVHAQDFAGSSAQQDTSYAVEQTPAQQTVSEVSQTEPPTGVPATYCFTRGTWRPC